MLSELRNQLRILRTTLWLRPALFSLAAILLVVLFSILDDAIGIDPVDVITLDATKDILRFAAGGMLTITTVTLSVLMLVLSLAAGQASPRAVPELMGDPVTQNALSSFLGTLVFALTGLAFLEFGGVRDIGVTGIFGLVLLLVALSIRYLVQWIHHVADSLKLNRTIERIYLRTDRSLERYLAHGLDSVDAPSDPPRGSTIELTPVRVGYVQLIDLERLDVLALDKGLFIDLLVGEGDFVHAKAAVLSVRSEQAPDEETIEALRKAVVIGPERSPEGDPRLGIGILAEIASRALSPGINDPQSAVVCVNYLGALLIRAGAVSPDEYPPGFTRTGRVAVQAVTFSDLLVEGLRPIIRDGAGHIEVTCAVLGFLDALAVRGAPEYLAAVRAEVQDILHYGRTHLKLARDQSTLEAAVSSIQAKVEERPLVEG